MAAPIIEFLILIFLVLANGLFAMAEIAVVSARPERLEGWVAEGRRGAAAAMRLGSDPNRFLSTVQIGITVIGILSGAFGGATLATRLSDQLAKIDAIEPYSGPLGVGIVVVGIAYLSLIIGEIVPKRLGLRSPERVASTVAGPMAILSKLAAPFVAVLSLSTETVLKALGARENEDRPVTEEEIKVLMRGGVQAGAIEEQERQMVAGVFRLADRPVRVFMTPRQDIIWCDVNDSPEEIQRTLSDNRHSRFPVCDGDLDNAIGMVVSKDLLVHVMEGRGLDLKEMARPALFIPETTTGPDALRMFKESGYNAGLVMDENGGVEGLVTLGDILDEITGAITPALNEEFEKRESGWSVDGMVGLDEIRDFLLVNIPVPEDESDAYFTLGGFVMARLGRVPVAGESFEWGGMKYEVERMIGRRVDRVFVSEAPQPELPPEPIVD